MIHVTETLFDLIKPAVTMEAMKDMVKTMVTAIVKVRLTAIVKAGLTAIFMAIKHLYCCCYTVNERVTIPEFSDLVNLPIYCNP